MQQAVKKTLNLSDSLLNLSKLSPTEIEALGKRHYSDLFLDNNRRGIRLTHDGEEVAFFDTRFSHAFCITERNARGAVKTSRIHDERVARIKWILPLIQGKVPQSECWLVPGDQYLDKRLYVTFYPLVYVVWLEPREVGGWLFSTAYIADRAECRKYCKNGQRIWKHGNK